LFLKESLEFVILKRKGFKGLLEFKRREKRNEKERTKGFKGLLEFKRREKRNEKERTKGFKYLIPQILSVSLFFVS
jgi:hypothetical protein